MNFKTETMNGVVGSVHVESEGDLGARVRTWNRTRSGMLRAAAILEALAPYFPDEDELTPIDAERLVGVVEALKDHAETTSLWEDAEPVRDTEPAQAPPRVEWQGGDAALKLGS